MILSRIQPTLHGRAYPYREQGIVILLTAIGISFI